MTDDDEMIKDTAKKIGMDENDLKKAIEDLRDETDVVYKFLRERVIESGLTITLAAIGQSVTSFMEFGTRDFKSCVGMMNSFADLIKKHAKAIEEKGEAEFNAARTNQGFPVERKH